MLTNRKILHEVSAFWASVLFLLCLCASPSRDAYGQGASGTISGIVQDIHGGVIPGATVTVRGLETNVTHTLKAAADGRFSFPELPIGPYELTVEAPGMAKYARGPIVLLVDQVAVVNASLEPASVTETITITEDAPLLNTTNPEMGVRFDAKRLSELPLSGQFGAGGGITFRLTGRIPTIPA